MDLVRILREGADVGLFAAGCEKLKYKAEIQPSELLDPVYILWGEVDVRKPICGIRTKSSRNISTKDKCTLLFGNENWLDNPNLRIHQAQVLSPQSHPKIHWWKSMTTKHITSPISPSPNVPFLPPNTLFSPRTAKKIYNLLTTSITTVFSATLSSKQ